MGPGHPGLFGGSSGRVGEFLRATGPSCEFGARLPVVDRPSPVPPQQHCEGIFYGGVAGIQAAAAPLQAAAHCRHPVIPAAEALPPLGKKKVFACEGACHVSAAVRLQAAALKASRPLIRVLVINDNGLWINNFI